MSSEPECYGDASVYDPQDPTCSDCLYRATCSKLIRDEKQKETMARARERLAAAQSNSTVSTQRATIGPGVTAASAVRQVRTVPAPAGTTFSSAVATNAGLDMITAAFSSVANSFASIPRLQVPNIWGD